MSQRQRTATAVLAVTASVAVLAAGCSSSGNAQTGTTQSGATRGGAQSGNLGGQGNSATAAAVADVAKYSAPQPDIAVQPLNTKPPAGKTVAILTCGFPSCKVESDAAADGAKKLGWTVKSYTSAITPEAYQSTWNQMLQTPPDLIIYTGLMPNQIVKNQLAKVKQLKIPTVSIAASDPPDNVLRAVVTGQAETSESGKLMGESVVADAKGKAKTVFVWDPASAPIFGPVKKAFTAAVTAAGGSVDVLNISTQNVGKSVPGQVASYLQAHPDVKYAAFGISDFAVGVPQALKGAGISGVKILSRSPHANDLADIKNGNQWLSVAEENASGGYRCIDTLARILEGMPFDPAPVGWHQIITAKNVTETSADPATPGSPQAFFRAWHLSSAG